MTTGGPNPRPERWPVITADDHTHDRSSDDDDDRRDAEVSGNHSMWRERLIGAPLPAVDLTFSIEAPLNLGHVAHRWSLALFFHHADLERIRAWAEREDDLTSAGYTVFAISAQPPTAQLHLVKDELLVGFPLLSDIELELAHTLDLPMREIDGDLAYQPLTLLVVDERIAHVLYPVTENHDREIEWVLAHPPQGHAQAN